MRRLTQLHERTRRRIGLSGFVLLCLLPTVGMFTWGLSRHLPVEEAKMEQWLGELFGMKVTVESVDHPEPGLVRLQGLTFERPKLTVAKPTEPSIVEKTDEEPTPTRAIAKLASLEIYERPLLDPYKKRRDTICMTGTDLEVDRANLPELTRLIREAIDYRLNSVNKNVAISINRLQLFDESAKPSAKPTDGDSTKTATPEPLCEFSSLQFKLLALADGPQAVVDFRLLNTQDDSTSQPLRLRIGQRLHSTLAWFEFDTKGEPVPCRVLGMMLPGFNTLGPDAQFCGCFYAEQEFNGWKGEFPHQRPGESDTKATLSHVDLDYLINRHFAQTFSGQVDVTIEKGTFTQSRLQTLQGSLKSTIPGMIGQPLLAAASKELGLQVDSMYRSSEVVAYQNFAASFALDQKGLWINGGYPGNAGENIFLVDGRRVILWKWKEDSAKPADVSALLRTLAPDAEIFIPVGLNIQHLAERLPVKERSPVKK